MTKKPWQGRFKKEIDKAFEQFSESISFDQRLAIYDVQAGKAHIEGLLKIGVLTKEEAKKLLDGLKQIEQEIESKKFKPKPELEDIHMNIEQRLFELCGELAGKLHIGRSRNDLVVADIKLWLKDEIKNILKKLKALVKAIVIQAENNLNIIMPGYTHTRPAQPVLFSHWLLAYAWMFTRDRERLINVREISDYCPLGSGALAGSNFPLDRKFLAEKLGFSKITLNSMDAVSDRDFLIDFLSACALIMLHLSRLAEELIWMSGEEFAFFDLPEELCTGSSMMPNKKNPDSLELIRGKAGRVFGNLIALFTLMKSTPLAYNRDFQEDKERVFDSADTVESSLEIMKLVIKGLKPNSKQLKKACEKGFILATDLADYLVKKGSGFRQAHFIVGELVKYCEEKGERLEELNLDEFKSKSELFEEDVFNILSLEKSVQSKNLVGGTAPKRVKEQIRKIKSILEKWS